jgi:hypothetical protein
MKVIAINDAPTPENGYYSRGIYLDRAYHKGDIFECQEESKPAYTGYMIIWHDKLEAEMEVDSNNFITLEEYRNSQIDKIIE